MRLRTLVAINHLAWTVKETRPWFQVKIVIMQQLPYFQGGAVSNDHLRAPRSTLTWFAEDPGCS